MRIRVEPWGLPWPPRCPSLIHHKTPLKVKGMVDLGIFALSTQHRIMSRHSGRWVIHMWVTQYHSPRYILTSYSDTADWLIAVLHVLSREICICSSRQNPPIAGHRRPLVSRNRRRHLSGPICSGRVITPCNGGYWGLWAAMDAWEGDSIEAEGKNQRIKAERMGE